MNDPADHYWIVNGSTSQVWSSASRAYVPIENATYLAWRARDRFPTRIKTEAELWGVLAQQAPSVAAQVPAALDTMKDRVIAAMDNGAGLGLIFKVLFNLENRVRVLEARPTITANQYRAGLKALL